MVWFKVDDQLPVSEKLHLLPPEHRLPAMGLWTIIGAWCSGRENNGIVPRHMVAAWGGSDELSQALIDAGFWKPHPKGYEYHDWKQWNPAAEEIEEKRRQGRDRVAKAREKKRRQREELEARLQAEEDALLHPTDSPAQSRAIAQVSRTGNAGVTTTPTRPDPTRPVLDTAPQYLSGEDAPTIAPQVRLAFDSVWQFWPRQEHKQEAVLAFAGVVRKLGIAKATLAVKQHGEAYANSGRAAQFVPGLAKWLRDGRYEEPLVQPEASTWETAAEKNVRKIEQEREAMARGEKTPVQEFLSTASQRKEIGA